MEWSNKLVKRKHDMFSSDSDGCWCRNHVFSK